MKKLFFAVVLISMGASAQVPSTYFGMDFNSSNTAWPVINQAPIPKWNGGVIRMHDSGTKLYDIFNGAATSTNCDPRGTGVVSSCNWAALDKFAANALANNAVIEYTFSKMPTATYWSDCFAYTSSAPASTTCDNAFISMVKAIRDRVGCTATKKIGCVAQWEIWNEPNNNGGTHSTSNGGTPYWDGTIAQLVHVSRLVHDHVKTTAKGGIDGIDANALVIGPGGAVQTVVGSSGISTTTTGTVCTPTFGNGNLNVEAFTCLYLATTGSGSGDSNGKAYVDAVTGHFYPSSQTLSTMAELPYTSRVAGMQTAMTLNTITQCGIGISPLSGGCKGLVNSEWSWGTCSSPTTPRLGPTGCSVQSSGTGQTGSWRDDQSALLVKSYHLGVKYGMMGQYWYGWEFMNGYGNLYCTGTNSTIGCAADSTHTIPGQQSAAWAWGAVQWIVGKTLTGCTQTSSTWRCDYTGANGYKASVVWNSAGTGSSTTFTGITQTQDMYGNVTDQPTGSVTLTPNYYPVTIETIPATGSTTPPILLTDSYANSHYEAKGTTSNAASAYLQKTANLSDLDDYIASLTNLGHGRGTLANIPATCTQGDEYFSTSATAGQNKYLCTATDTWTQQTGSVTASGISSASYAAGGGTANAQTVTLSPAITSLTNGLTVTWLPAAANTTGTPTLNVNGLGAVTIVKHSAAALTANDIITTAYSTAKYNGTNWELQNPHAVVGSGSYVLAVSPGLSGTPTAPTASQANNSTQIATTAYVDTGLSGKQSVGVRISSSYNGILPASYTLARIPITDAVDFSTTCGSTSGSTASQAKLGSAATASTVISLKKNGTQFGTITFAAAGTSGTFSCTATSFAAGDVLTEVTPASPDTTAADLGVTLRGN